MKTKYAVREYVERDPRWKNSSRSRIVWAHALVAPDLSFHDDFDAPECPRWAVHGKGDLADLAGRLWDTARLMETHAGPPSYDDVELVVEILAGRNFGSCDLNAESGQGPRTTRNAAGGSTGRTTTFSNGYVLGCKGLERRAVVLCVNESTVRERARERLYVGMSRATDELAVVGDPDMIREVGGDAVARQLGL